MKKSLAIMVCLLTVCICLLSGKTQAAEITASGVCGASVTWTLDDAGTLTISGTGAMNDYASASNSPWYTYRTQIRKIVVGSGVTTISDRAFYGCSALSDVTIGKDVLTIGTYAFRGCNSLTEVTIPASVTEIEGSAFRACVMLTSIICEGNAPTMGSYVFNDGADYLTVQYYEGSTGFHVSPWTDYTLSAQHTGQWVVDVEASCTSQGSRHIDCTYCGSVYTETIPPAHSYINGVCTLCGAGKMIYAGTIGSNLQWSIDALGVLKISGKGSMSYANPIPWIIYKDEIKTLVIGDGVTSICTSAFSGCNSLSSVTIPGSVKTIDQSAFEDCTSLTTLSIPQGVVRINYSAFKSCTGLKSVTIADSVTDIGGSVFANCISLETMTIPFVGEEPPVQEDPDELDTSIYPQDPFGHLFGITSYPGCVATTQEYMYTAGMTYSSTYYIPASLKHVTVTGAYIPHGAFANCGNLISVTLGDNVTAIGQSAFANCGNLVSVTLGDNVNRIGVSAFANCSRLPEIILPDSIKGIEGNAFQNCTGLTELRIPNGVETISYRAFSGCENISSMVIPDSVKSIGDRIFEGCSSLESITIPFAKESSNNSSFAIGKLFGKSSFPGSVETEQNSVLYYIPASLKAVTVTGGQILADTFENCAGLTSVILGDQVTDIRWGAFENCTGLTNVVIGGSVKSIASSAFKGCSSLTVMHIPNSVTSIGSSAFQGCSSLTAVYVPSSVTSLGTEMFRGCGNLTGIWVDDNNTAYSSDAYGALHNKAGTRLIQVPGGIKGSYVVADTVTEVRYDAFRDCSNLTKIIVESNNPSFSNDEYGVLLNKDQSVLICCPAGMTGSYTIADSVTTINEYAFWECEKLTKITIVDSVTTIGTYAFAYCTGLRTISIPESVTKIGNGVFRDCSSLSAAIINADISQIGLYWFEDCTSLTAVSIAAGIESVLNSAFTGVTGTPHVAYGGTQTQWQNGSIGNNEFLAAAEHIHYETVFVSVETCVGSGIYCPVCDVLLTQDTETGDHDLTVHTQGREPTCTEAGMTDSFVCTVCNELVPAQEIPALGHTEVIDTAVAAGCETVGMTQGSHCGVCSQVLTAQQEIPATGHSYGQWAESRPATFYENGEMVRCCSNCDSQLTKTIPQLYAGVSQWNLSLSDDLVVNFYLQVSEQIASAAQVQLIVGGKTQSCTVSALEYTDDGYYRLPAKISAAQMTEEISVMVIYNGGIGCASTYTVQQYAKELLANDRYAQYHALVRAMLHYGAAAQLYFGNKTDALANQGIDETAAQPIPEHADTELTIVDQIKTACFYGASLVCRDKIAVRFYFQLEGSLTDYRFTCEGRDFTMSMKDDMIYLEVGDIMPQQLDQPVVVTVTAADGTTLCVSYSPMHYMVRMNVTGSDSLKALLLKLYHYHLAAKQLQSSVV